MKKRDVKLNFNFSNRILYSLIALLVLAIVAVGVYALTPGTAPNPGHLITESAPPSPCTSGQFLKFDGTTWVCSAVGTTLPTCTSGQILQYGSSGWACASASSSQWTTSGSDISYAAGKVGIGTSSAPTAALEVDAPSSCTGTPLYACSSYTPAGSSVCGQKPGCSWTNSQCTGTAICSATTSSACTSISGCSWGSTTGTAAVFVGSVQATAFLYSSDRNLKENILPLSNSLGKINQLQGVSFNWKGGNNPSIGLIAQDVEKVYPELVSTDSQGLKSLQYGNLVAPLIESVKELNKKVEAQQKQIDELNIMCSTKK